MHFVFGFSRSMTLNVARNGRQENRANRKDIVDHDVIIIPTTHAVYRNLLSTEKIRYRKMSRESLANIRASI